MDWTEYANATSHTAIWIGLSAVHGYAAEVVEDVGRWSWCVRKIGAADHRVVAEGEVATGEAARVAAESAASIEEVQ